MTRVVNNTVYHLFVITWGLRYLWIRGNIKKGCFEIEDWGTSVHVVFEFRENFKKILFYCFLPIKRILKALFSFIPWLSKLSGLSSYDFNSKKRYTLRILSMCLGSSTLLFEVKPSTFNSLFDCLRWAPFSLALHLCSG